MKKCCRCNTIKPKTEFYKCNKAKDKLQSSCKTCKKKFNNTRNNPVTVDYKVCNYCNVNKHQSEFRRNKTSSDGLRHECKSCKYEQDRKYRQENWDKIYPKKRQYAIKNRDELNRKGRERYHSNLDKYRAISNFYEQARRQSQPKWALDYKEEWDNLYNKRIELEKETNNKYHIDHIIPVIHDKVCGLSVPWNYQVITEEENIRKSNKFDGTYDNDSWR